VLLKPQVPYLKEVHHSGNWCATFAFQSKDKKNWVFYFEEN